MNYEDMKVLCMYGVMQPVLRRTVAGALRYGVNTLFAPLREQSVCGISCAIVHNLVYIRLN
jgi:hypothetical protein